MRRPVAWMAENRVAANLLMLVFIAGGLFFGRTVKQEVFPEVAFEVITVTVPYPGAGAEEVEDGILLLIEDALTDLDDIREVAATAVEGVGTVTVTLADSGNPDRILADIKNRVDGIANFPEDAEEPVIALVTQPLQVLTIAVHGEVPERSLYDWAEIVRETLLRKDGISKVDLTGTRPAEIAIEVADADLARHDLSFEEIADRVRAGSETIPAGGIRSDRGEILVRSTARKRTEADFRNLVLRRFSDGSRLLLEEVAFVQDGYRDAGFESRFDGKPCVILNLYRSGKFGPVDVATTAERTLEEIRTRLPEGLFITIWYDRAEVYKERLDLLVKNSWMGLALVITILAVFLEIRLAFWVSIGIPISFLGALFFLPATDVSINMISLFGFIMALGIVVDDAIVVGENIHAHRQMGKTPLEASVDGTLEVAGAVTFSVLTTMAAFAPLLSVSGMIGKLIRAIPVVVMLVLAVSLMEAFFILPAHLSGLGERRNPENGFRRRMTAGLDLVIRRFYRPSLQAATRWRYVTLSFCMLVLFLAAGLFAGGIIGFRFLPDIENEATSCTLLMPLGTPEKEVRAAERRLVRAARDVVAAYDARREDGSILRNLFSIVGGNLFRPGIYGEGNEVQIWAYLEPWDVRRIPSAEFLDRWRKAAGEIAGAESLVFSAELSDFGPDIAIRLSHRSVDVLEAAGNRVKEALAGYSGVTDIRDSQAGGKPEWGFRLTPEGESAGLTEGALARQVRNRIHGIEALRFQRGRDEVRVMVRYPDVRVRDYSLFDGFRVRLPGGGEAPFSRVARRAPGRATSSIKRVDGRRVLDVTATATGPAQGGDILEKVVAGLLPQLREQWPDLDWSLEGEAGEQKESFASILHGVGFALFVIYVLMAIPFRSYAQPFLVMAAIPPGVVGAVFGHLLLGLDLSMMSLFGMVALTGVVVNDSLVMVDFVNRNVRYGMPVDEAVMVAGERRFRPILLTSLTTFLGLTPIMLETSLQAQFLIPMAASLAFGILFSTGITLFMVPCLYRVLEDLKGGAGKIRELLMSGRPP